MCICLCPPGSFPFAIFRNAGIDLQKVFNFEGGIPPADAAGMSAMLACHMTDMQSEGIICMRCGLPLWMLKRNQGGAKDRNGLGYKPAGNPLHITLKQLIGPDNIMMAREGSGRRIRSVMSALTRGGAQNASASQKIDDVLA